MTTRSTEFLDLSIRWLPRAIRSKPTTAFALLAALMFGVQCIAMLPHSHLFVIPGDGVGFLEDISTVADFAVLNPLVLALLLRFFSQVQTFVIAKSRAGVINLDGTTARARLRVLTNRRLLGITVLAAAVVTLIVMRLHTQNTLLIEGYFAVTASGLHFTGLVMMTITGVYIFLLLVGMVRVTLWLRLLRSVFTDSVRIDFMHSDGAGGLRSAGAICMTLTYLLAVLAVTLGFFVYTDVGVFDNPASIRVLLAGPLYFIVTPIVFFYPLVPIHEVMERERERHLDIVSERFNQLFLELQSANMDPTNDRVDLSNSVAAMKDLQSMYAWIERLPRWPIDTPMYVRFAASLLLPLIGYLSQVIANDLIGTTYAMVRRLGN